MDDLLAISIFDPPASILTMPTQHDLTWDALASLLTTHEHRADKDGRGWSPATYAPGKTRANSNVRSVSCFVGDVDHGTMDDYAWVKGRLEELGLAYALHSTFQNAEDDVRFRVIVPFTKPVPADGSTSEGLALWNSVWSNATHQLLYGRNDESTKDLSRFFYLPAAPPDSLKFAEIGKGTALDWAALPQASSPEVAGEGAATTGAVIYLGYRTLHFLAFGAPVKQQRSSALVATRALLASGRSVDETAEAVWRGLQLSPCGDPQNPWTYQHALQIARDLARRPAPPLRPASATRKTNPDAQVTTLSVVESVFLEWLHLPDLGPLHVVLGSLAANLMVGDPSWLLVIGPPGGGKTEVILSISEVPDVHMAGTLTEAALLSGTPKKELAADSKGGLLRTIGEFGILVCKDFTSVLSISRDSRAAILAALREIYDGSWTRDVGTDGGRKLSWSGKLGLIAGCTQAVDSHHAVISLMGERFIFYRLPPIDERRQARAALTHVGREKQMRAELSAVVSRFFAGLNPPDKPPALTEPETAALVDLSTLAVRCRSAVERDPVRRDIDLIPDPEAPGRLALALARLLGGLKVVGVRPQEAWAIVQKTALDCMPAPRRAVFDFLVLESGRPDTTEVATALRYPTTTARRALEDLTAHEVVERTPGGEGKADLWNLSPWAVELYERGVGWTFPEKAEEGLSSSTDANMRLDDISGKPPLRVVGGGGAA